MDVKKLENELNTQAAHLAARRQELQRLHTTAAEASVAAADARNQLQRLANNIEAFEAGKLQEVSDEEAMGWYDARRVAEVRLKVADQKERDALKASEAAGASFAFGVNGAIQRLVQQFEDDVLKPARETWLEKVKSALL